MAHNRSVVIEGRIDSEDLAVVEFSSLDAYLQDSSPLAHSDIVLLHS